MADQLNVLVICGSLRKGSYNAALTRALPGLAPPEMKLVTAPTFGALPLYNADIQEASGFPGPAEDLAAAIRAADGVLFVSPEYNWSMPGALKNAIDWVSRMKEQPFKEKPVALQSAAGGILGGSRMQYHLRQSRISVDVILFGRPEVIVTFSAGKFEEKALERKDVAASVMIRQPLAEVEKFIRR